MKRKTRPQLIAARFEVLPVFAALFAVGIAFSSLFSQPVHLLFFFAAVGCLLLSWPDFCAKYRVVFLCAAAVAAGCFYGSLRIINHQPSDFFKLDGTTGSLKGVFTGEFKALKAGAVSFKMNHNTYEFDEQLVNIPGLVHCHVAQSEFEPEPEQTYQLNGRFVAPEPGRLPVFKAQSLVPVPNNAIVYRLAGKLQRKIRDGLNTVLPRRHAAIVTGLILGDTSQISTADRKLFRETGISHLLAVSGQHVMILIMLLAAILHWLQVPPISRSIVIIAALFAYTLTTSGSPSIWRALIMYLCVAAVLHVEAFPSPIRPLGIAALLLLLFDPSLLFNAAFQLSFTAVFSIILLRPPIEHFLTSMKMPDILARYLAVTFAANLGTIPMTAYLFGTVSVSALLVNPLILWSFSYILPVTFLTGMLSFLWPASAIIVAPGLTLFLDGLLSFLQWTSQIPGHFFYVGNLSGLTIATAYSLMLYVAARFNHWQIAPLTAAAAAAAKSVETPEAAAGHLKKPRFGSKENQRSDLTSFNKPEIAELRLANIFRSEPFVRQVDAMLASCKRRPLKNSANHAGLQFPVNQLTLENQNLFYQLADLDRQVLKAESERLLQAHVFLMALIGNEILNRISFHLNPPPSPEEIRVNMIVRDRHLATAVLTDSVLNSSLLTRASDEHLMLVISRVQAIYFRARNQLERILLQEKVEEAIEQHLSLRRDLLAWCGEFIDFDQAKRRQQNSNLRTEQ